MTIETMEFLTLLTAIFGAFVFLFREIKEQKWEVHGEINTIRGEIKALSGEINSLRHEIKTDIETLRREGKADLAGFRLEVKEEFKNMAVRITQVENRLTGLAGLETRIAVIESKLGDINTNISYLMWHAQTPPPPGKELHGEQS